MVRILHTLTRDLPTSTVRQIDLLCAGLTQRGFENSICSFESNSVLRQPLSRLGETISFFSYRSKLNPIVVHRFGQKLSQVRPDVIHHWGKKTDSLVLLSNRLYGHRPVVVSADATAHRRWLTRTAHFVVSNEQAKLNLYSSAIPSEQIVVIRPGVKQVTESNSIRSLHTELDLPGEVRFVAAMGDLLTEHRFKDVIWTLDLLRVIHPEMHLVVFGEGRAKSRLQAVQRQIMSSDSVHFWDGESDIQDLMRQCFCFWHASPGDNLTILEAMAAGIPVVAVEGQHTEAIDRRTIVRDGETGFLVPFGDCAEIARKTNMLLNHPDRATQVQRAAQQSIRERHSSESMVNAFLDVYERSMQRSAKAA